MTNRNTNPSMQRPPRRQEGAVTIMVALSMLVLLALAALVIDGGLAYLIKARLNAAVDSAALAGARAVTAGNTEDEQVRQATAAAARFFEANIPDGYMLSRPTLLGTKVGFDAGTVTIDVRAEAPMPVSLMQVLGTTSLKPTASAQTIRRDLDMVFVVDTSGSMRNVASAVQASAKSFLNRFNVVQDRVGLVSFGWGAEVDVPIRRDARGFDRQMMNAKINNYVFYPSTASVEGMWKARNELAGISLTKRSSMRVIVFFSDGVPTAFGAYLPFRPGYNCNRAGSFDYSSNGLYPIDRSNGSPIGADCNLKDPAKSTDHMGNRVLRLPDWYNAQNDPANPNDPARREFRIVTDYPRAVTSDLSTSTAVRRNVDGAARNLAEAVAAKAQDEGTYVFTLGLGADLRYRGTMFNESGEDILKCMANVPDGPARCRRPDKPSGMYCYAATENDLTPCFSRLASAILRISK